MSVGNVGMASPFGAGGSGSGAGGTSGLPSDVANPDPSAGNAQTTQDFQDQKAQNAFQEAMTKASNMESKRNQTRMGVIANLK